MSNFNASKKNSELFAELNAQCAKISFKELEKHFARGVMLVADDSLDLVQVGVALVEDDAEQVTKWRDSKLIRAAEMDDAALWYEQEAILWALVCAPWVLVQETN